MILAAGALQFLEDFHGMNALFQKKIQGTIEALLSIAKTESDKNTMKTSTLMSTAKGDVVVTESGLGFHGHGMGLGNGLKDLSTISGLNLNSPSKKIELGRSQALVPMGQSPIHAMNGGRGLDASALGAGGGGAGAAYCGNSSAADLHNTSLFAGHGVRIQESQAVGSLSQTINANANQSFKIGNRNLPVSEIHRLNSANADVTSIMANGATTSAQ